MTLKQRLLPHPVTSSVLVVVWLLLNHSVSAGHIVLGAVLGWLIPLFTRRFFPEPVYLGRIGTLGRFLGVVLWDIVLSNIEVARRTTAVIDDRIEAVLNAEEILHLQRVVREVPVAPDIIRYALALVRQTRVGHPGVPEFVETMVAWGAGPRAVQYLILGGKARALLHGRSHVATEDIQALAKPVLRHRLVVNFAAESEGITQDVIIERLLANTPTKEDELTKDARFQKIFAS